MGAGNYPRTNHLYATENPLYNPRRKIMGGRQAHSIYFTLLPELGAAGCCFFFAILKGLYNRYAAIRDFCPSKQVLSDESRRARELQGFNERLNGAANNQQVRAADRA